MLKGFPISALYVCVYCMCGHWCLEMTKLIIFIDNNNGRLNANSYDTLIQLIVGQLFDHFYPSSIQLNKTHYEQQREK